MRLGIAAELVALAGIVAGQGKCFVPNGTNRHDLANIGGNKYEPCEGDGHSMCCNTVSGDKCQPNGLCWNEGARLTWRESCSDPTWQSPKCLKLCIHDEIIGDYGVPSSGTDVVVTQCEDGSYCCGNNDNTTECCVSGKGVRIVDGQVVTASSSSSIGPTTTATFSQTPTASSVGSNNTSSSNSGVIGGAVGGGVGAVVLGLGAWYFWYRNKKRWAAEADAAHGIQNKEVVSDDANYRSVLPMTQHYPSELPVEITQSRFELGDEAVPPTNWR